MNKLTEQVESVKLVESVKSNESNDTTKLVELFKLDEILNYVHIKRIREELELVKKLNLTNYIVRIVQIYNKYISKYPVVLRGSAGSSLLLYYLGINKIDPVKYSIPVSRFINTTREDFPDIDFDVPTSIRNDLIRDVLASNPDTVRITSNYKHEDNEYFESLIREDPSLNVPHNSGIVIYSEEQKQLIDSNIILPNQIKLTKDDIGKFKLKKIDLLSNTALEQLYCISSKPVEDYNMEDSNVFKFICEDDGVGITFAETPAIQYVIKILKPSNIEELSICLSLIRPLASNNITNDMNWDYLKEQIIYDDDFIIYLNQKLDLSLDEADEIRRLFKSRSNPDKMLEFEMKVEKSNLNEKEKLKLKYILVNLCKYGFCKAHSINYARMIYCLYWNKLREPKKFWKSTIKTIRGYYRDWVYIRKGLERGLNFKGIKNCSPFYHLIYTGYWIGKDFVSRCYFRKVSTKTNELESSLTMSDNLKLTDDINENDVNKNNFSSDNEYEFRGIIAGIGGVSTRYKKYQMVITLGYDNDKFINIHLNKKRDLSRFKQIIGKGYMVNKSNPHIVVTKMTLL